MPNPTYPTLFIGGPIDNEIRRLPYGILYYEVPVWGDLNDISHCNPEEMANESCGDVEMRVVLYKLKRYKDPRGLDIDVMVIVDDEEMPYLEIEYTFSRHGANLLGQDCCMAILQTGVSSYFRRN